MGGRLDGRLMGGPKLEGRGDGKGALPMLACQFYMPCSDSAPLPFAYPQSCCCRLKAPRHPLPLSCSTACSPTTTRRPGWGQELDVLPAGHGVGREGRKVVGREDGEDGGERGGREEGGAEGGGGGKKTPLFDQRVRQYQQNAPF